MRIRLSAWPIFLGLCLSTGSPLPGAEKKNHKLTAPPTKVHAADVVAHLEQTISWYRHVGAAEQLSSVPMDLVIRDLTLQRSLQALQLAFDFGRAEAAFLAAEQQGAAPQSLQDTGTTGHNLTQAAANAGQRVTAAQNRLNEIQTAFDKTKPIGRPVLEARRREAEAQLALAKQVQSTLQGMLNVVGEGGFGNANAAGLLGQISTLERSVPEARHAPKGQTTETLVQPNASKPATNGTSSLLAMHPESAGLITLATSLFSLQRARGELDSLIGESDDLLKSIDYLKTPLLNVLRSSIQRSQTLVDDSTAQSVEQVNSDEKEIEALTARFKQLSTASVPIAEQQLLVEAVRTNFSGWRNSIRAQSNETAKYLFLRIGFVALAIAFILVLSTVWNRLANRYIHDPRRRRHFVVLRRVVVVIAILVTTAMSFITDFSSIATYAGFLTAGIALGLQNVILSVVAYFFLIGKYGIKVGDRITISGVTGDVIDVGLVRLYMMELTGSGREMHPTGRTVVYANSIVFQPSALFKHVPGADYTWHTVSVMLTPETDYDKAKHKLTQTVQEIYGHYRSGILKGHTAFSRSVEMNIKSPEPDCELRHTEGGLEFRVHFPADLRNAPDMDDRVLHALRETLEQEPDLHPSGSPRLILSKAG